MPHDKAEYPYGKLSKYPHMKPADVLLWERFIEKYPNAYDTCEYDVWIGTPPPFDTTVNLETGGDVEGLYRLKIDVVAHTGGRIDVIELKPRARLSSLGQVKGYARLYARDLKPTGELRPVIITDTLFPDMPELCKIEGIELIIV